MDRVGDAAMVVEEQKEQVRALRTEMEEKADGKEKDIHAMRVSVCTMDKKLVAPCSWQALLANCDVQGCRAALQLAAARVTTTAR